MSTYLDKQFRFSPTRDGAEFIVNRRGLEDDCLLELTSLNGDLEEGRFQLAFNQYKEVIFHVQEMTKNSLSIRCFSDSDNVGKTMVEHGGVLFFSEDGYYHFMSTLISHLFSFWDLARNGPFSGVTSSLRCLKDLPMREIEIKSKTGRIRISKKKTSVDVVIYNHWDDSGDRRMSLDISSTPVRWKVNPTLVMSEETDLSFWLERDFLDYRPLACMDERIQKLIKGTYARCEQFMGRLPESISFLPMFRSFGTCTKQKHITLHPALLKAPSYVLLETLFHEYTHMKFFSHGEDFQKHLDEAYPGSKIMRNRAREYKKECTDFLDLPLRRK